jgi:hypothetical protein
MMGFVIGHCLTVVFGNLAMVAIVHRVIPHVRLWPRLRTPFVGAVVLALVARFALLPWASRAYTLPVAVVLGAAVFVAVIYVIDRPAFHDAVGLVRSKKLDVGEETEAPIEAATSEPPADGGAIGEAEAEG